MEFKQLLQDREREFRIQLGKEIKAVRTSRAYSLTYLAEKVGIKPTTLENIEAGKFSIKVDFLVRFSIILDHEFVVIPKDKEL